MVYGATVVLGREEAEWDPERDREEEGRDGELGGRREALLDLVGDLAVRRRARPEVGVRPGLELRPVLLVDGLVEPVALPVGRDQLRSGALTEQALGGAPRQGPDPEEDEDREPEENRESGGAAGERRNEASISSSAGRLR